MNRAEVLPITAESIKGIVDRLHLCITSEKPYQVVIQQHYDSLKARQRALAHIWYQDIDRAQNNQPGEAEAYCKYHFGFKIICRRDPDLRKIIVRMLDGLEYEAKLTVIRVYSDWFPCLREGAMTSEEQAEYLSCIQNHFGQQGIYLTSPKEKDLLNCKQANV